MGTLDANGEKDVKFDVGVPIGLDVLWIAALFKGGNFLDISNVINVKM